LVQPRWTGAAATAGLEIVSVGAGTHFLPEDQPEAISRALAAWLMGREKAG